MNRSEPMTAGSIWRLLLRGLGWGIVASLLGNIVFGLAVPPTFFLVDTFARSLPSVQGVNISLQDIGEMLNICLIFALFGLLFSFIPAAVGGIALASLLKYLSSRAANLLHLSTAVGGLVGGVAGVVSSLPGLYSFPTLAYLVVPAWIIASVAGGLVSRRLALYIARGATTSSSNP
jgi:hypothetical protein